LLYTSRHDRRRKAEELTDGGLRWAATRQVARERVAA
jgi:hypothetical protein